MQEKYQKQSQTQIISLINFKQREIRNKTSEWHQAHLFTFLKDNDEHIILSTKKTVSKIANRQKIFRDSIMYMVNIKQQHEARKQVLYFCITDKFNERSYLKSKRFSLTCNYTTTSEILAVEPFFSLHWLS